MSDTTPILDSTTITQILNVFQNHIDSFTVPLLRYSDIVPLLNDRQLHTLYTLMNDLQPVNKSLKTYLHDEAAFITLQPPEKSNEYQQKFVRVSNVVDEAFGNMAQQLKADINRDIIIVSGYRSPIYHALIFCRILYQNNFNLQKTLREIQPPGYSEHQDIQNPAIDISDINQTLPQEAFVADIYPWLAKHAGEYGFIESYPKTQSFMIWEPWHWKLV